nr:hydroxymethylglutaryl-CoA synthase-like [Ipomoea batatas]GMD99916.1 hydroxymethylglutaryl-CoA synthase-like [Ipomoea batatas]
MASEQKNVGILALEIYFPPSCLQQYMWACIYISWVLLFDFVEREDRLFLLYHDRNNAGLSSGIF